MLWRKKRRASKQLKIYIVYILGFTLSISVSLPAYIQSSFIEEKMGIVYVGLVFMLSHGLTAISINIFPRFIKKVGAYLMAKNLNIAYGLALLILALSDLLIPGFKLNSLVFLLLFIVFSNLLWLSMDVILESASSDESTGLTRTIYLTLNNLTWIFTPLAAIFLVDNYNYYLPFLISALLAIPMFIIINLKKKDLKDTVKKYSSDKIKKSWKKLWRNKDLRGIFMSAVALNVFFSGAVLYIPIYLHQVLEIPWSQLGWVFAFMLVPFVLVQTPAGWLADKRWGEKEMLSIGMIILIISLFLFSYIKSINPWTWAFVLFFSRVGAALVEAMRDTYFFKKVSAKDLNFISIFRSTTQIGYIVGTAIASLTVFLLPKFLKVAEPIPYVFIILAVLLIANFYFIIPIKDTK